jgi:hypothetical protein
MEIPDSLPFEPTGIVERISTYLDLCSTTVYTMTHRDACIIIGLQRLDHHTTAYGVQAHKLEHEDPRSFLYKGSSFRIT